MRIAQILFSQGFGSRRDCAGLVARGEVAVDGAVLTDPDDEVDVTGSAFMFYVNGHAWPHRDKALLMLNKPAGYECSRQPKHHPSILRLLPEPLQQRGVQPVGRLDEDTTGLLLLTDDGKLIHRLTHPRQHVAKVYEVSTAHAVDDAQIDALRAGVVLHDDLQPVQAAACERTGDCALRLTITEGRYHQVKRMVAAAGNRVVALHRSAFGALLLPSDLAPGQWRWLPADQVF